jgi:hypothetical protein
MAINPDTFPPSGFDRADGSPGFPGTPTPADAEQIRTSGGGDTFFEEMPDSPEIEEGEHATVVHRFKVDLDNAAELTVGYPRGTILVSSSGDQSRVLTNRYLYQKGDYAIVEMTAEGLYLTPEDDFRIEPADFNPSIFLHPYFINVRNYNGATDASPPTATTGPQLIGAINNIVDLPSLQSQADWQGVLETLLTNALDDTVIDNCNTLIGLLRRGVDTFYLSGLRVSWSEYSFTPAIMQGYGINPGGYIEDPVDQGGLPYYFWADDGTPTGGNILTQLAQQVNPTFYPPSSDNPFPPPDTLPTISWLRQCDELQYERTWFKITHNWVGGPLGTFDYSIYPVSLFPTQ